MTECIKKEDAKKWLTNLREDCGRYQDLWHYAEALDQIIELLSVDVTPKWIPCKESLPEPHVAVLGYAPEFDNIYAVYYDSVSEWMNWSPVYDEPFPSCQGEIVAWMPLTEPYKGERKDDE